jgi:hypothetical protein
VKLNIFFLLIAALILSACTVNINQPNANTSNLSTPGAAPPAHAPRWSAVVCSSRAKSVMLSAGTSETDGNVFATWTPDSPQRVFDLPPELQHLPRIYFKAIASDKNQVEMCLLYDGKAKKRIEFDDDEDVMAASTDSDELDKCRCTE